MTMTVSRISVIEVLSKTTYAAKTIRSATEKSASGATAITSRRRRALDPTNKKLTVRTPQISLRVYLQTTNANPGGATILGARQLFRRVLFQACHIAQFQHVHDTTIANLEIV